MMRIRKIARAAQLIGLIAGLTGCGESNLDKMKRADAMGDKGNFDSARAIYDLLAAENPDDGFILYRRGLIAMKVAKSDSSRAGESYLSAKSDFQHSMQLSPEKWMPRFQLARTEVFLGDTSAALRHFESTLAIDSTLLGSLMQLSHLNLERGDTSAALHWLNLTRHRHPENTFTLFMLANVYRTGSQFHAPAWRDSVFMLADASIAIDPRDVNAYSLKALLFLEEDKPDSNTRVWRDFIKAAPDNYFGYYHLAQGEEKAGRYDQALELYSKAARIDSSRAFIFYERAQVQRQLGHLADAAADSANAERLSRKP